MRIGVAQIKPVKGDIKRNIANHKKWINLAVAKGTDCIIFPELSITGYEPELTNELGTTPDDSRFSEFQEMSDAGQIIIGVGVPIRNNTGICITIIIFRPQQVRQTYYKNYLHSDEEPFFVSGQKPVNLIGAQSNAALAICYEILVPEHAENAFKIGAEIYIASVAKSVNGIGKALVRLADIVLMANCVGYCDNFECGGKSSVWNNKGLLTGQLNSTDEGILIFDTDTQKLIQAAL